MRRTSHASATAVLTAVGVALLASHTSAIYAATDTTASVPAHEFDAVRRQIRDGRYVEALSALERIPTPSHLAIFQSLLLKAEIAARQGKPELAHELYVQAEGQAEDLPDADLGQVRADLLSGEFRRASAFALLVSGEHSDSLEALAIGAFLEERAGQTERALNFLTQAQVQHPDSVALLGAFAEILIDRGHATQAAESLDAWIQAHKPQPNIYALRARAAAALGDSSAAQIWRTRAAHLYSQAGETLLARTLDAGKPITATVSKASVVTSATGTKEPEGDWSAPYFEPFPRKEGRTANGFVVDQGSRVITLSAAVSGVRAGIYVRNGLGRLRTAHVESVDPDSGLATLRLDVPYEARWSLAREQFAAPVPGRPASAVGFGVADPYEASWPAVTQGFLIRPQGRGTLRMSADFSAYAAGSAIFDPQGHLVGVISPATAGAVGGPVLSDPMVIPMPSLPAAPQSPGAAPVSPASPVPAKELLERAQAAVVVVLIPK